MAFNLNKNEADDASKKFDLSKNDPVPTVVPPPQEGSSKTRVFALLGLLVIGAGAWFFLSKSGSGSGNENAATATVKSDTTSAAAVVQTSAAATAADTLKQTSTENVETAIAPATTDGNTAPDATGSNNSKPDRTSAAGFNNSIPATFAKGSASVSNPDKQLIKELVVFLQKNPAAVIHVNGYASSEGELAVNQQVSRSRADAFKSYLVAKGIPGSRINATGKGIDNPISSNDTEEGRMKNRRVEISIQ